MSNCQILQTIVNRFKSDREDVPPEELRQHSMAVSFSERELDVIEMAYYGNVNRYNLQCKCKTVGDMMKLMGDKAMSKPFINYSP